MVEHGFQWCNFDCYVYFKDIEDSSKIYLLLYVDDMLIACQSMDKRNVLKQQLKKIFKMKDLGTTKKILGVKLIKDRKKGILSLTW